MIRHRIRAVRVGFAALAAGLAGLAHVAAHAGEPGLGEKIFDGSIAVSARLTGEDAVLPARISRCSNCHTRHADQLSPGERLAVDVPQSAVARLLSAERLTTPLSRRGAPPTAYDEAGFCRVIREGIDPAMVMIPRLMPRYEMDDAQCSALWRYLARPSEPSPSGDRS